MFIDVFCVCVCGGAGLYSLMWECMETSQDNLPQSLLHFIFFETCFVVIFACFFVLF